MKVGHMTGVVMLRWRNASKSVCLCACDQSLALCTGLLISARNTPAACSLAVERAPVNLCDSGEGHVLLDKIPRFGLIYS